MRRVFCDMCGAEMNDRNTPRLGSTSNRLAAKVRSANAMTEVGVEVIQSHNGVSNDGDFCKYCILDALNTLDDRPRHVSAKEPP